METSAHGLNAALRANRPIGFRFWLGIFVLALVYYVFEVYITVHDFLQYDKHTKIILSEQTQIPFPQIIMCNLNPIRKDAVGKVPQLAALELAHRQLSSEASARTLGDPQLAPRPTKPKTRGNRQTSPSCPPGWMPITNNCLKWLGIRLNHNDAVQRCAEEHLEAKLPVFQSDSHRQEIAKFV